MGASAIRDGSHIATLDMAANNITDDGLPILCEVLKSNCRLKKLSLRANRVQTEGIKILSDALLKNTHLVELDLGGNILRDEGITYLKDLIGCNQSLRDLDLGDNCLGDDSGKALLKMLDFNDDLQLTRMNISQNHITEPTEEKILLFLRTHAAELARLKKQKKAERSRSNSQHGSKERAGRSHSGS